MAELTPRAERVLARAHEEAQWLGHDYVGTEHLLLALLDDPEGIAGHVLHELGVAERVRARVLRIMFPEPDPRFPDAPRPWGSVMVLDDEGSPIVETSGWPRQFFVDRDGSPVLDEHGRRLHLRIGADGRPVIGDDGHPLLDPVPWDDEPEGDPPT